MAERASYVARLRECSTVELEHAYAQLEALEQAARAERLEVLALLDERKVGRSDGCSSTADWVSLISRVRASTARREVETARRLRDLPALCAVAHEGRLSWDQLAPLAEIATPTDDEHWARERPGLPAATLDAHALGRRRVSGAEALERHRQRSVRWWTDHRVGMVRISGRLADADGENVITALRRACERSGPEPPGNRPSGEQRYADALVHLASSALAQDVDRDRACVVLHVSQEPRPVLPRRI